MGVRADGTLTKIEMLTIKETAGLGMKADESEFKDQFSEINTDAFNVIKAQVVKSSDNEINAISGATITSDAVTNTVNAGLAFANDLLDQGVGGVVRE
jgi:electron transport complex protein RnfG